MRPTAPYDLIGTDEGQRTLLDALYSAKNEFPDLAWQEPLDQVMLIAEIATFWALRARQYGPAVARREAIAFLASRTEPGPRALAQTEGLAQFLCSDLDLGIDEEAARLAEVAEVADDPVVRQALDLFGGEIIDIRRADPQR